MACVVCEYGVKACLHASASVSTTYTQRLYGSSFLGLPYRILNN